jgi:hypothetical protein
MAYPKIITERPEKLADDLIWGVKGPNGIAAELGTTVRHAYYLISKGAIPVRKLGARTVVASRSKLRERFGSDPKFPVAVTEKGTSTPASAPPQCRGGR